MHDLQVCHALNRSWYIVNPNFWLATRHRERRVRCDEQKPICCRCRFGDRVCRGSRYGREREPVTAITKAVSFSPESATLSDIRDIMLLAPLLFGRPWGSDGYVDPDPAAAGYTSSFMMSQGRGLVSYVHHLPRACGHSKLLDISMQCVAEALRQRVVKVTPKQATDVDVLIMTPRHDKMLASYSKALEMLQRALNLLEESVSAETLCATILLYTFEVCCVFCKMGLFWSVALGSFIYNPIVVHYWEKPSSIRKPCQRCRTTNTASRDASL